jgi:class 3 adenylate cyclase
VLVPENPRFRIGAPVFAEILRILRERLLRGWGDGERGLRLAVQSATSLVPYPGGDPQALDRFVFAEPVREYLLQDLAGTGGALLASRPLRREVERWSGWSELLAAFAEVTRCVRRAEAIGALRRALEFTGRGADHAATRERFLEGRIFRLASGGAVQSGVRTATILFADIRGFTRAAEGVVSEGELARELYELFDPAALVVRRFGGTVDKYLGDGFMATFPGGLRAGGETLAAVRAAVAIQQVLGGLRRQGRTEFRMGLSLHTGRVAVARFLRDARSVDTTLIGRQVNLAARLSGSHEEGGPAAAVPARVVGEVAVDAAGSLDNRGIAVSGTLLDALRAQVGLEPFRDGDVEGFRCYDRELCLWMHFGYVGEARFRGLEAAVPVWSLVAAAPAAPAAPAAG